MKLEESLKLMDEMSSQSMNHLLFLSKPRIFDLVIEETQLDSDEDKSEYSESKGSKISHNNSKFEYDNKTESVKSSNQMKLKVNDKSIEKSRREEEELADLSVAKSKEIVFKPAMIRLQPTILGYSRNLDHYVLAYNCINDKKKYNFDSYKLFSMSNNNKGNLNEDLSIHSDNSSVNLINNKGIKAADMDAQNEEVLIDIFKLKSVNYNETTKRLLLEVDSHQNESTNISFRVNDDETGSNFQMSLRYMVNLVKLKAIVYKVKNSVQF